MQLYPHVKYVVDKFKHKLPKEDLKRYAKEVRATCWIVEASTSLPNLVQRRSRRRSSTLTSKTTVSMIRPRSARNGRNR